MEVHIADALFDIADASGMFVGGGGEEAVFCKQGGEEGKVKGCQVKGHGFVGRGLHLGHLAYGGEQPAIGGIPGGKQGGKGEFSFHKLACGGEEGGIVEKLEAVGTQEDMADISGLADAGCVEFIGIYEHDIPLLEGMAVSVDLQASGYGREYDFQFFVPVDGDMGAGGFYVKRIDVKGDVPYGTGSDFLVL